MLCKAKPDHKLSGVNVAMALARLLEQRDPAILKFDDAIGSIFSRMINRTEDFGYWRPRTKNEQDLCKAVLTECIPGWTEKAIVGRNKRLQTSLQALFGLDTLQDNEQQASVILVPKVLFAAMLTLAERGWGPITPFWLGQDKDQYNGPYDAGCGVLGITSERGPLDMVGRRMFLNSLSTYTLHIPDRPYNTTTMRPSTEWEEQFVQACQNLAAIKADPYLKSRSWDRYHALGLQACRDIPIVVNAVDKMHYWKVTSIKGDRYEHTIRVTDGTEVLTKKGAALAF